VKVTRLQIIERGLACRCPNCGQRTLFVPGTLFKVNARCSACGLTFEKGEGTFLGPFVLNYTVTAFGFIVPVLLLHTLGKVGPGAALGLCFVGAPGLPLLLYRLSWGWWLLLYYFFLQDNLPSNLEGRSVDDE
jgi:uncharacterized protein (DUF983 family)